jgi:hypothetical protein
MEQRLGSTGPAWSDLTDAQRHILYGAGTGGWTLIELLNGWVDGDDAAYWNRKGAYVVPLAQAAQSLVNMGLVEVWSEPVGVGEDGLMLREDASAVVGDPGNWWRYDPDDNWDPSEDLSRYAGFEDSDTSPIAVIYTVVSTDSANELGLIRVP